MANYKELLAVNQILVLTEAENTELKGTMSSQSTGHGIGVLVLD